jgi:hypothetical protein
MVPCPCCTHTVQGPGTRDSRVERLVSEHLSAQGRLDPNNLCPIKTWTPPIGASGGLKIFKNILEFTKLWPPKLEGSRTQKKQTTKHYKFGSQTPKKLLICCSVVIRVQRWFVKLKVMFLEHFKRLKRTRNEKVRSFESKRGLKRRKKKTCFVNWKAYFSSFYFFITPFPLHLKDESKAWGSAPITF